MAKFKVYELAKEVDKSSKEVLAFLQENGIEAKAAQSSVEDGAADMVRKHFGVNAEAVKKEEAPKAETVKTEEVKAAEAPKAEEVKKEEAPKKKKNIVFVTILREAAHLDLCLYGRVTLQTLHGYKVHIVERKLGKFGYIRLDEDCRARRVDAAR